MPTIAELVDTAPAATAGYEIQLTDGGDPIRWVVELADPSAAELVWHDITGFYAGDSTQRGAAEYQGRYTAMVARVTLETSHDQLAPTREDTSGLFGVHVSLGAGLLMRAGLIRVNGGSVVTWWPIFTGRVEKWGNASRARGQTQIHEVTVIDTISSLVDQPVEATLEEPWEDRISAILTDADWLFGHDIYGAFDVSGTPVLEVPARDEQESAIVELDTVTDPAGIVWRSRRNGRLVFHPAPFDTFHEAFYDDYGFFGDEWANPLLDEYPDGLTFSYLPDIGDIAYLDDVAVEPFGIEDEIRAVVNDVRATYPAGSYAVDDAVSISRFGRRIKRVNWIVPNDTAVDQILDRRAFATKQARPLVTTIDDVGFFPAMALIDHLDPATVIHATHESGSIVTATTLVRSIAEERTVRLDHALSWKSTVELDVDATAEEDPLLPVENLAFTAVGETSLAVSWTNPTQPFITPTEVQFRIPQLSLIWLETDYPATSLAWAGLTAETQYTVEVRLVRKVNGLVTNASTVEAVTAITDPATVPNNPGPDPGGDEPGDTTIEIPDPDPDCDLEWELQEDDGTGWTTILSGDRDDLIDNGDGTWDLNLDESVFDPDKLYRVRSREVCGGIEGPWLNGQPWDPPDDWTDPCTTPPALSVAPYDSEDLLLFVPKICAPDTITEAVTGNPATKGPGFGNLLAQFDSGDDIALQANAAGGIIAYGESGVTGLTGDKTLGIKVSIATAGNQVLFETAAMRISANLDGAVWHPSASVYTPQGISSVAGDPLDLDTVYDLRVTYDAATATLSLEVDGVEVNSISVGEPRPTVSALPIWWVGATADSWVTNAALWSGVVSSVPNEPPTVTAQSHCWWADDLTGTHANDDPVSAWVDRTSSHSADASSTERPLYKSSGVNGRPAVDFDGTNDYLRYAAATPITTNGNGVIVAVVEFDAVDSFDCIWGTADEGSTTPFLVGMVQTPSTNRIALQSRPSTSNLHRHYGDTAVSTGVAYIFEWSDPATGQEGAMRVNNAAQSLTDDATEAATSSWLGNIPNRDSFTLGALRRTTVTNHMNGRIAYLMYANQPLTSGDRTALYSWLSDYYGITI